MPVRKELSWPFRSQPLALPTGPQHSSIRATWLRCFLPREQVLIMWGSYFNVGCWHTWWFKECTRPSPHSKGHICSGILTLKGSICLKVIVPKAACCLIEIDYRLLLLQEFRASGFGFWFGDMGNLSCMGCLSALILIEMLKEGVWAGIGIGPEEMKATAASRPQNHPSELSEGQCYGFPRKRLCCSQLRSYTLPVVSLLAKSWVWDSGWWSLLHWT